MVNNRTKMILILTTFALIPLLWNITGNMAICPLYRPNEVVLLSVFGSRRLTPLQPYELIVFTTGSTNISPEFIFSITCDGVEYSSTALKLEFERFQHVFINVESIPDEPWSCKLNFRRTYSILSSFVLEERYIYREESLWYPYTPQQHQKTITILVQTDKPVYKPKDTVKFRIVILDKSLQVQPSTNIKVEILDSANNVIKRWKNVTVTNGMFSNQLPLSEEPNLGSWVLSVTCKEEVKIVNFQIEKYILPKFRVNLKHVNYVTNKDPKVTVEVRTFYTYGKGINGNATVTLTQKGTLEMYRWQYFDIRRPSPSITKSVDIINGIGTVEFDLSETDITAGYYFEEFTFLANVTEGVTKVTLSGESTIKLYREKYNFQSLSSNTYIQGLPFTVKFKLTTQDDIPIYDPNPDAVVISCSDNRLPIFKMPLLRDGVIEVVYPAKYTDIIKISAINVSYKDFATSIYTNPGYSTATNVGLQISYPLNTVYPGETIAVKVETNSAMNMVKLNYFLKIDDAFVNSGTVRKVNHLGDIFIIVTIPSLVTSDRVMLCVFFWEKGHKGRELIFDNLEFYVRPKLNKNRLNLQISHQRCKPGDEINFRINVSSSSIIAMRAVDESVLLLPYENNDITTDHIENILYSTLPLNIGYGYDLHSHITSSGMVFSIYTFEVFFPFGDSERLPPERCPSPISQSFQSDRYVISQLNFAAAGHEERLEEGTNQVIEVNPQQPCATCSSSSSSYPTGNMGFGFATNPHPIMPIYYERKVRKHFPETWIWEEISAAKGSSITTYKAQVPDTMTSWIINMFSLNPMTGLAVLITPQKLTTFQPFFLTLNLPYSVPRGKAFSLQVLVHNYLDTSIIANVTMDNTEKRYRFVDSREAILSKPNKLLVVAPHQVTALYFVIMPIKFGNMNLDLEAIVELDTESIYDSVSRKLLVIPEGIKKTKTQNILIDLRLSEDDIYSVPILFPSKRVRGSEQVKINVVGDIMGLTTEHLENLIDLPTGCGEQNMVKFVPNIVILRYMKVSGILTAKLEEKLLKYLEIGYMQQLKFLHPDGSYSAFGNHYQQGSTWLTAFVIKSFAWAMSFITIEENVLEKGINFLISVQNATTGEFLEKGRIFETAMQGGSGTKGIPLTAYVTSALVHISKSTIPQNIKTNMTMAINRGLNYISRQSNLKSNDVLSIVLATYALQAGKHSSNDKFYHAMNKLAIVKEEGHNHKYWDSLKSEADKKLLVTPLSVELTSYAMLTYIRRNELESCVPIFKWLLAQRNSHGGFKSTQDTIVGLMALAMYADKAQLNIQKNMTISIEMTGFTKHFSVNNDVEEVQEVIIPYSSRYNQCQISGFGSGTALVQVSTSYYITDNDDTSEPAFIISAKMTKLDEDFELHVSTRATYASKTGMAIVEVSLPSKYQLFDEDLDEIKNSENVDKAEISISEGFPKLVVYYAFLTDVFISFTVRFQVSYGISGISKLSISAYEYNGNNKSVIFEKLPEKTICEMCIESNACDIENCT